MPTVAATQLFILEEESHTSYRRIALPLPYTEYPDVANITIKYRPDLSDREQAEIDLKPLVQKCKRRALKADKKYSALKEAAKQDRKKAEACTLADKQPIDASQKRQFSAGENSAEEPRRDRTEKKGIDKAKLAKESAAKPRSLLGSFIRASQEPDPVSGQDVDADDDPLKDVFQAQPMEPGSGTKPDVLASLDMPQSGSTKEKKVRWHDAEATEDEKPVSPEMVPMPSTGRARNVVRRTFGTSSSASTELKTKDLRAERSSGAGFELTGPKRSRSSSEIYFQTHKHDAPIPPPYHEKEIHSVRSASKGMMRSHNQVEFDNNLREAAKTKNVERGRLRRDGGIETSFGIDPTQHHTHSTGHDSRSRSSNPDHRSRSLGDISDKMSRSSSIGRSSSLDPGKKSRPPGGNGRGPLLKDRSQISRSLGDDDLDRLSNKVTNAQSLGAGNANSRPDSTNSDVKLSFVADPTKKRSRSIVVDLTKERSRLSRSKAKICSSGIDPDKAHFCSSVGKHQSQKRSASRDTAKTKSRCDSDGEANAHLRSMVDKTTSLSDTLLSGATHKTSVKKSAFPGPSHKRSSVQASGISSQERAPKGRRRKQSTASSVTSKSGLADLCEDYTFNFNN